MIARALTKGDIDRCLEIFAAVEDSESQIGYPQEDLRLDLNAAFDATRFSPPRYVVVEIDGNVVGFAGMAPSAFDEGVYGLFWAVVDPSYQGLGVGKTLVESRLDLIRNLGGEAVVAVTKVQWHLKRFGFRPVMKRSKDYTLMMLNLTK